MCFSERMYAYSFQCLKKIIWAYPKPNLAAPSPPHHPFKERKRKEENKMSRGKQENNKEGSPVIFCVNTGRVRRKKVTLVNISKKLTLFWGEELKPIYLFIKQIESTLFSCNTLTCQKSWNTNFLIVSGCGLRQSAHARMVRAWRGGGGGRDVVSVNSGVANSQGVVGWSPGKGWERMERDGKERGGERDREIQIEEDRGIEIGDR